MSWIMIITENDFPGMKHFALGLNGRATLSNIDVHSGECPRKFHNLFGHPNSTVTRAFVGGHVKGGRRAMMQRLGSQGGIWFRESDLSVGKCRLDFDRVSGLNDYAQTHDGLRDRLYSADTGSSEADMREGIAFKYEGVC